MWCVLTISSGPETFLLSVQATGAIPVGLIGVKKETAVQCVEFIADQLSEPTRASAGLTSAITNLKQSKNRCNTGTAQRNRHSKSEL